MNDLSSVLNHAYGRFEYRCKVSVRLNIRWNTSNKLLGLAKLPLAVHEKWFLSTFFSFHCLEGKSALNFHPSAIAYVGAIVKGCTNTILTGTRPVKCIIAVVFNDFTSTRLLFLPISPSPFYNLPGNLMSYDHKHERHLYRFKQ